MLLSRRLTFLAMIVGLASITATEAVSAETAKEAKQALKKKLQAEKMAEEAKKSAAKQNAKPSPGPSYSGKANPAIVAPLKPEFIGGKADAVAVAKFIDAQVNSTLQVAKLTASPIADDSEFVRRVYLDIIGVIPTGDQARSFIDSTAIDKRAKLIDELLASPKYAQHQADIWDNLLIKKTSDNRKTDFAPFKEWIQGQFKVNRPWNLMVSDMVTATGTLDRNAATGFFFSNTSVDKMADETSKLFLGQSLQCAQCHNHPFTDYKQTEYWAIAQFFIKTVAAGAKAGNGEVREVNGIRRGKNNELPESAKIVAPKFLRGEEPKVSESDPYRPILAKWLASSTNPFLAKAMVNRTWSEFFGAGIVNPVDDMRPDNKPSHPEMLDKLAADFAANNFDIKHLIRGICNSQTYQRSSAKVPGNADAEEVLFARMTLKVMTPEQLFDSLAASTGFNAVNASKKPGGNGKVPGQGIREQFATFFLSGAETANTTEYEAGIPQALRLMNAKALSTSRSVQSMSKSGSIAKNIEELYLSSLSRRPTSAESGRLTEYLTKHGNTADTWSDILWVLVNSSEFTLIK